MNESHAAAGEPQTLTPPDGPPGDKPQTAMPFLKRYPIIAGALAGVLLRLLFSAPAGSAWSAMVGAFIWGAPVVVGALTVYLAERQRRRSWDYYFWAPCVATLLFVLGTLLILIEGIICAIVIVPMFTALGVIGGLAMGIVCRLTKWPRPVLYSFGALPLLLASLGGHLPTPDEHGIVERTLRVHAPARVVWRHLHEATEIEPHEVADAWAFRIGVPLPVSGITRETLQGRVRESRWGKGVRFDEIIQDWQPERHVRWTYRFTADSFPPGALDDHVLIGGHYFDLLDTSYSLAPRGESTLIAIRIHYRISTQFNLYANWVAQALLGNFADVILRMYKNRSESE